MILNLNRSKTVEIFASYSLVDRLQNYVAPSFEFEQSLYIGHFVKETEIARLRTISVDLSMNCIAQTSMNVWKTTVGANRCAQIHLVITNAAATLDSSPTQPIAPPVQVRLRSVCRVELFKANTFPDSSLNSLFFFPLMKGNAWSLRNHTLSFAMKSSFTCS